MQCSTPQDRTVGVIWTSAGQLFVHPQLVINPDWGFIFNCTRPKYQIITACLICSRIRRHDCVLLIIQPSHKIFHHPEYANHRCNHRDCPLIHTSLNPASGGQAKWPGVVNHLQDAAVYTPIQIQTGTNLWRYTQIRHISIHTTLQMSQVF